jgi:hypothetical protein
MEVRFGENLGKAGAANTSKDKGRKCDEIMQQFERTNEEVSVQVEGP